MDNANSLTGSGPIAHSEEMMWVIEGRRVVGVLGRALVVTSLVSGIAAGAQSTMKSGAEAPDAPLVAPVQRPGPALRSALATLERGDSVAAERQLLGIVERHPVIANDAAFLLAELQMESGRYQEVVDSAPRWQSAPSRLRTRFLRLLGEALAGLGEEKRARAVWDSAARATGDSGERAALRIAIAESHDRSGDPAAAVDPYLQVWTRDPASESAPLALEGLDRLERELGHALRDGNDYRRRGDSLYRKRHNERALAAYEHALGLELPEGERLKVREGRARTLFRLRRYTEAANAYADLPGDPDRRIQLGRALARAGKISEGVTDLEGLGAESAGEVSARALLLAGLLREGEGDFEPARQHFLSVTERAPSSGTARAARWR
ncbi:MAG: tetratricopeptide repeat protein, partial [Myxococcota bacterium]